MKNQNRVYFITSILTIGIIIGCVIWYKVSVSTNTNYDNNKVSNSNTTNVVEISKEEDFIAEVEEEALFTLENYPKVDASLAIHPMVNSIASNFLQIDESELNFKYTKTRSSEVYRNVIDGKVDVAIASPCSDEDLEYAKSKGVELEIIPLTSSAFVFIVNSKNKVDNLTIEQIQDIYSGKITNWKEVGGYNKEIVAYQRPNGSGSQTAMMQLVMNDKELQMAPTIKIEEDMGGLIDAVAEYDNSENAIGYSYFYYVNTMYKKDTIKIIGINGVTPSIETIKSSEYPLYTNGFIVYRKDNNNENLKLWLDTIFSKRGSKIIEDNGYVPIN